MTLKFSVVVIILLNKSNIKFNKNNSNVKTLEKIVLAELYKHCLLDEIINNCNDILHKKLNNNIIEEKKYKYQAII